MKLIIVIIIKLLVNTTVASGQNATYFLAYNFANLTESLNLNNLLVINKEIKNIATHLLKLKNKSHYHNILFQQVIKGCATINLKLNNLGLRENKRHKRDTAIINLGLISEYLGISSTQTTDELSNRILNIENEIKDGQTDTKQILLNYSHQLIILKKLHELERNNSLNSVRSIFYYLKLTSMASHLRSIIHDIELSHLSWKSGHPSTSLFDINVLQKGLTEIRNNNSFPLIQSNNFTQIANIGNSLDTKIRNNILTQTVTIPLIDYNDICHLSKKNTLECIGFKTYINESECTFIGNDKFACKTRPCKIMNSSNSNCTRISDHSYFLDTNTIPCAIKDSQLDKINNVLLNKEQVIYIELSLSMECNGLLIPSSKKESRIFTNHLLVNISENTLSDFNYSLDTDHRLVKDLKKFNEMNVDNQKILKSFDYHKINHHITYVAISNSVMVGFLILSICIGTLIFYLKNRSTGMQARAE